MRSESENAGFTVKAIAGTEVVLLCFNADEEAIEKLDGFAIERIDTKNKLTQSVPAGRDVYRNPVRSFLWSDYEAEPDRSYTYVVTPMFKKGRWRREGKSIRVSVRTEDPTSGTHGVYFNRGVAASRKFKSLFGEYQRYYLDEKPLETTEVDPEPEDASPVDREVFAQGFIRPKDVPDRAAYKWLSRGLEEALFEFIRKARKKGFSLRAAVYEFTYLPVIQEFVDAIERGVDVRIIHHAKRKTIYRRRGLPRQDEDDPKWADPLTQTTWTPTDGRKPPGHDTPRNPTKKYIAKEQFRDEVSSAAVAAVSQVGLKNFRYKDEFNEMLIERTLTGISHNKFVVLLKDNEPIEVWTGSTNFTEGGIFGQSNVGHVVRDPDVARSYLEYWEKLSEDPKKKSSSSDAPDAGIQNWTVQQQPDLTDEPPTGITTVFSPRLPVRNQPDMLDWYADRLAAASNSVFFTAAFSVADQFMKVLRESNDSGAPYLRYIMLEGTGGHLVDKFPLLQECPQNRIAWGDRFRRGSRPGEDGNDPIIETLTGLNDHVSYLHTKYMLLDPLSDDPVVITGSANFSRASTVTNDENMLIIRGDTAVADIYLGEFMRLFNHFRRRNLSNQEEPPAKPVPWTAPWFDPTTQEFQERLLFAGPGPV